MPKSLIYSDVYKPYCVEVYYGPMWSKKTLNVLIAIDALKRKGIPYQVFKPRIDTRYFADCIVSRFDSFTDRPHDDANRFLKEPAEIFDEKRPGEIAARLQDSTRVVVISEAQLAGEEIAEAVRFLQKRGLYVICEGLNLDYTGEYFSLGMSNIINEATHPHSLHAICAFPGCGEAAYFTQKLNPDRTPAPYAAARPDRLQIGDFCYEPRCILHHQVPGRPELSI